ncbi:hypothetical protein D3C76_1818930 [compost metagenome]
MGILRKAPRSTAGTSSSVSSARKAVRRAFTGVPSIRMTAVSRCRCIIIMKILLKTDSSVMI